MLLLVRFPRLPTALTIKSKFLNKDHKALHHLVSAFSSNLISNHSLPSFTMFCHLSSFRSFLESEPTHMIFLLLITFFLLFLLFTWPIQSHFLGLGLNGSIRERPALIALPLIFFFHKQPNYAL